MWAGEVLPTAATDREYGPAFFAGLSYEWRFERERGLSLRALEAGAYLFALESRDELSTADMYLVTVGVRLSGDSLHPVVQRAYWLVGWQVTLADLDGEEIGSTHGPVVALALEDPMTRLDLRVAYSQTLRNDELRGILLLALGYRF